MKITSIINSPHTLYTHTISGDTMSGEDWIDDLEDLGPESYLIEAAAEIFTFEEDCWMSSIEKLDPACLLDLNLEEKDEE